MKDPFPPVGQLAALLTELSDEASDTPDLTIPTGLQDVDETLQGGLRVGHVATVAGISGVGASTFALGLARNAAFRENLKTLFIAPDSSEREILVRVIAAEARLPVNHLRSGRLDDSDLQRLDHYRDVLNEAPLLVNASWSTESTSHALLDSVRIWLSDGVRFVVVDGIAAAEPHTRDLFKGLKRLAIRHDAAIVVVSNTVVPKRRHSARPALEDLRDYEEMADLVDLVFMLHRDDMHDWDSTRVGEADLEIIKHRYGPSRRTTLAFQGHYARFVKMTS
jgi:replicative DNA helicase